MMYRVLSRCHDCHIIQCRRWWWPVWQNQGEGYTNLDQARARVCGLRISA